MTARWPLACFLALGLFWGTWAALLPDIKAQVGASDGEMGLALVAAGIGSLPAMILTSRIWRRLRWWMLPLAGVFFGVAQLGPIFATSPVSLAVALVVVGASSGVLDVSMNSAVSDIEVAHSRRLMYGAHALFSLAVLVGSVTTGFARQAGAAPGQALVISGAFAALIAIGCLTVARQPRLQDGPAAAPGAGLRLFRALAALAFLGLLSFVIEDATQNWSALLLEREVGTGPAVGGLAPGLFGGAMFVGRTSGQWLGARFSDRVLLTAGALITAAGLLVASVALVAPLALGGIAASGAGVALVAPALFARGGRATDERNRAAGVATMTTVGYFGFVIGPFIVGLLAQAYGLRFAFGALAGLALVTAAIGLRVLRPSPSAVGPPSSFEVGEELLRTGRG